VSKQLPNRAPATNFFDLRLLRVRRLGNPGKPGKSLRGIHPVAAFLQIKSDSRTDFLHNLLAWRLPCAQRRMDSETGQVLDRSAQAFCATRRTAERFFATELRPRGRRLDGVATGDPVGREVVQKDKGLHARKSHLSE
jgi:hypothetical protein